MKSFILPSGETAYVPTDNEIVVIKTALEEFKDSLPVTGRGLNV